MNSLPLVLASTSPYRRELLSRLQIPFAVIAPEVDETPLLNETPEATALRLSQLKAKAVQTAYPHALIIGSDQVATVDGQQIGKPGTHEKAVAQLRLMCGKSVVFHSALSLYNSASGSMHTTSVPTTVHFRELSDAQIEAYLRKDQPYNCAGSARIESLGIAVIEKLEGEDPNALIGLPMIALIRMLAQEGLDVLTWQAPI
ncbi:Maf family nucleotide pyrophosphatase [Sulfuriferula sp. GW1]|uniref:Maf family nucleotide pyrophosphatase n=1 Tax=Sulfuriferula sp. GW1 TaxID=3345111 RepID=UPI0039AF83AE